MTTITPARIGMALAAVLVQAGCTQANETAKVGEVKEQSRPAQAGGSSVSSIPVRAATKPTVRSVVLPEGTDLAVRITTALSTNTHETGQPFTGHLDQPLMIDGREILPRGTEVEGTIVESDKGGRVKGRALLALQLTRIHGTAGSVFEISTVTRTVEANATKKADAVKVGIGSGVGAAIGAIAGGGRGAAIGAAAGAGAGGGVVLATHGDPALIPSETVLQFSLRYPVTIRDSR